MDIFAKATKKQLRFETPRGLISTEDVWNMPLTHASGFSLDDLAIGLQKRLRDMGEESFVVEKNVANTDVNLRFEIVKAVIAVRLEERKAAKEAAANKERKELLGSLIAEQQVGELRAKGLEELQKMYNEL